MSKKNGNHRHEMLDMFMRSTYGESHVEKNKNHRHEIVDMFM